MKCAILSGGSVSDYAFVKRLISGCDMLICADSGLSHAQQMRLTPDIVVGDFDSLGEVPEHCRERIILPTEKDDTDTMSAARIAVKRGADEVLLLACTGTRLDHTLGNLFVADFLERHSVRATLIDEHNEVFLTRSAVKVKRRKGCFLSLLPFCCEARGVSISGTKYTLNNATLTSSFPIGVSNEFVADFAEISVTDGTLAVFISRD